MTDVLPPTCNPNPDVSHGFDRSASLEQDRYVCVCESCAQPHQGDTPQHTVGPVWSAVIGGKPLSRIDMQSCLKDWKEVDE